MLALPAEVLVLWPEVLSTQVGDVEADAGAAWVHGVKGNPLIEDGWIRPEDWEIKLHIRLVGVGWI